MTILSITERMYTMCFHIWTDRQTDRQISWDAHTALRTGLYSARPANCWLNISVILCYFRFDIMLAVFLFRFEYAYVLPFLSRFRWCQNYFRNHSFSFQLQLHLQLSNTSLPVLPGRMIRFSWVAKTWQRTSLTARFDTRNVFDVRTV